MSTDKEYDVIIVGSGIAGAIVAYKLGQAGKKVLILEAGPKIPADRSPYMKTFFKANAKTPESPYPPITQGAVKSTDENPLGLPDPGEENTPRYTVLQIGSWRKKDQSYFDFEQQEPNLAGDSPNANFAYGSSYERIGGGTTWHWLGTSLRFLKNDFQLKTKYGVGVDWPDANGQDFYDYLVPYYEDATNEINVAGDKDAMDKLYSQFDGPTTYGPDYDYPMPGIIESLVDDEFSNNVTSMEIDGEPVYVTPTPQGRNSRPGERRQCAGNTNCIPICPIQAKYDATVTIARALQTGNVDILYQHVASKVLLDPDTDEVSGVECITYETQTGDATGTKTFTGKKYVMAAHAIETPKLMLMSKTDKFPNGVANSSDQMGRNLMDHIMYLGWGLAKNPVFPYRGPLSTSGIESVRDGAFRSERAAYRIEIGNEGWQWAASDPFTTLGDYVFGLNNSQTNASATNESQGKNLKFDPSLPDNSKLFGKQLVDTLNGIYTRQIRLGYLIEQLPYEGNRVMLSDTLTDNLGLPRPKVNYQIPEDYVRNAFVSAKQVTTDIFNQIGATEYTQDPGEPVFYPEDDKELTSTNFQYQGNNFKFYGAGHIVGTYRIGTEKSNSVLNYRQQSWDHSNLYMVGSGVFPTLTTANPTLTIAAMCFSAADNILEDLNS